MHLPLRTTFSLAPMSGASPTRAADPAPPRPDRDPKPENTTENTTEDIMLNELFGGPLPAPHPEDTHNSVMLARAEAKRARKAAARRAVA